MLKPINFLGGIAWWAAVRRGGVGYPDPRLVKIYDRTVVPTTALIERFIRPPFGQTVFCVARVPNSSARHRRREASLMNGREQAVSGA